MLRLQQGEKRLLPWIVLLVAEGRAASTCSGSWRCGSGWSPWGHLFGLHNCVAPAGPGHGNAVMACCSGQVVTRAGSGLLGACITSILMMQVPPACDI